MRPQPRIDLHAQGAHGLGLERETCEARSLFDRRRVCTGLNVVSNRVTLYLAFDRIT